MVKKQKNRSGRTKTNHDLSLTRRLVLYNYHDKKNYEVIIGEGENVSFGYDPELKECDLELKCSSEKLTSSFSYIQFIVSNEAGDLRITDGNGFFHSFSGTFLNEEYLHHSKQLKDGDYIEIGFNRAYGLEVSVLK